MGRGRVKETYSLKRHSTWSWGGAPLDVLTTSRGARGLTGCWGAPGRSLAVSKIEYCPWVPEEMETSEADFFTTRPAAERTGGQLRQLGNTVASYRKLGGGSGRGRHSHGQEYRLTSHTECSQAGPITLQSFSLGLWLWVSSRVFTQHRRGAGLHHEKQSRFSVCESLAYWHRLSREADLEYKSKSNTQGVLIWHTTQLIFKWIKTLLSGPIISNVIV